MWNGRSKSSIILHLMTLKLQGITSISRCQNNCIRPRNGLFHLGWVPCYGLSFFYQTLPQTHEMEPKNGTSKSYSCFLIFLTFLMILVTKACCWEKPNSHGSTSWQGGTLISCFFGWISCWWTYDGSKIWLSTYWSYSAWIQVKG